MSGPSPIVPADIMNAAMGSRNPSELNYEDYYKEFNTNKEQLTQDAQTLKKWFYAQPHLPHLSLDDSFFERILLNRKFSIERSKESLDLHFTLKTALPEFFAARDPMCSDIQTVNKLISFAMLPDSTQLGYNVMMAKFNDKDPTHLSFCDSLKWAFMIADHLTFNTEELNIGIVIVQDLANMSLGHVAKLSLPLVKKAEICASKGYGVRVKGVHYINPPPFVATILSMLKATVSSKIKSRVHVHTTLESLHLHVDRHVLPVEYGGDERKLSELADDLRRELVAHRDWYLEHEVTGRVDETKRPGKAVDTNEMFGLVGSFKKLAVD